MPTTTRHRTRPNWAKHLPAHLWRHLVKIQGPRPTKAQLRRDVAYQQDWGIYCHDCSAALRLIDPTHKD